LKTHQKNKNGDNATESYSTTGVPKMLPPVAASLGWVRCRSRGCFEGDPSL
jgi:hypothetical protein